MKGKALFVQAFLTAFVLSVAAQDLIVNVNLTLLDVVVQDKEGSAVLDLTVDDFEVIENGQPRPVRHLSIESEPIAIGLAIDRSSSISPVKNKMEEKLAQLLQAVRPDDQVFLVTFAGTDKVRIAGTANQKGILAAVRKTKLGFGTRFYDAFIHSLQYLSTSRLEQRALIAFSDGAASAHWSITIYRH